MRETNPKKIAQMKHVSKHAGCRAGCDLGNQCKSKKCHSKILTLNDDPNNCAMKRVDEVLNACSKRAKLKKTNRNNLLDFHGCAPEILVRSNTQKGTRKCFIANDMIYQGFKHCSSFMKRKDE